jgi:hypothetical protein
MHTLKHLNMIKEFQLGIFVMKPTEMQDKCFDERRIIAVWNNCCLLYKN